MATAAQAVIAAANTFTCTFPTQRSFFFSRKLQKVNHLTLVRASTEDADCNVEECAPDKEVGKVSVEWLAGEKTKISGTFPPRNRGWTGYVEKDTAGQTNIYSVEPAVYVAESVISSGTAGSSADGAENTAAITAGVALIAVAAASSILLQVGKNSPPVVQKVEYSVINLIRIYHQSMSAQPIPPQPSHCNLQPTSCTTWTKGMLHMIQHSLTAKTITWFLHLVFWLLHHVSHGFCTLCSGCCIVGSKDITCISFVYCMRM